MFIIVSVTIHPVVVHRRDEAIRVWRNWIREDLRCIPVSGFGLTCLSPV